MKTILLLQEQWELNKASEVANILWSLAKLGAPLDTEGRVLPMKLADRLAHVVTCSHWDMLAQASWSTA